MPDLSSFTEKIQSVSKREILKLHVLDVTFIDCFPSCVELLGVTAPVRGSEKKR